MAETLKGHRLQVAGEPEQLGGPKYWRCECGHDLGPLSVHKARRVWREHKSSVQEQRAGWEPF